MESRFSPFIAGAQDVLAEEIDGNGHGDDHGAPSTLDGVGRGGRHGVAEGVGDDGQHQANDVLPGRYGADGAAQDVIET